MVNVTKVHLLTVWQ